jgi:hypothetical protein
MHGLVQVRAESSPLVLAAKESQALRGDVDDAPHNCRLAAVCRCANYISTFSYRRSSRFHDV